MSNEYFQPGSVPAPNTPGSSAIIRGEFASIALGFDKLPIMAGHAGEIVTVNGTGTGLVASGVATGGFATLTGAEVLTNKTMSWAANTFVGFSQGLGVDLKAPINSPSFTGAPSAPTPPTGDASSRLATTFFVTNTIAAIGAVAPGNNLPLMDGVAAPGIDPALVSRQDHVHPSDTSRAPASAATAAGTTFTPVGTIAATDVQLALQELDTEKAPLASPGFTGVPTAPTVADSSDTTTKIATTAWVQTRLTQIPVSVRLSDNTPVGLATTPVPGVGVEASRYDHVHALPSALQIPNTPAGTIAATNVQAALNELDGGKQAAATAVQKDSSTGAARMPAGTTAQRPVSPVFGDTRGNSTDTAIEWWNGAAWAPMNGEVTLAGVQTLSNKTLIAPVIEVIKVGSTNAVSLTASGLQFTKNKLINGEVTRINQRGFNGTWSGKSVWETQPATIAGKEGAYGYDQWFRSNAARLDGTGASENMAQWIEAGNFRPSTQHTLSGAGVTTTQITSPASGNWKIVVAQGATNVQVEEGSVATPFELRDIGYELRNCYRYFITYQTYVFSSAGRGGQWPVMMRAVPYATASIGTLNTEGYLSWSLNTYGSYTATQLTASAVI